ncbi:MAG: PQQ-binding-like beta-propeller repeat protein [Thermoanaerobaculia bacterium]|nr:PQQ-binding-like beta-propeller repeat protein [Thermoanaerobaculia bacterium]
MAMALTLPPGLAAQDPPSAPSPEVPSEAAATDPAAKSLPDPSAAGAESVLGTPIDIPPATLEATEVELPVVPPAIEAGQQVWEQDFGEEVRWFHSTSLGVVVVGLSSRVVGMEGGSGERIWELPIVAELDSLLEVVQTSIIVFLGVQNPGAPPAKGEEKKVGLTMAIDQFTGEVIWRNAGAIIEDPLLVLPIYDKHSLFLKTIDPISVSKTIGKSIGASLLKSFVPFGGYAADELSKPSGGAYLLDLLTGETRWRREINDPQNIKYYLHEGRIIEQEVEDVHALDLFSGADLWEYSVEDKHIGIEEHVLVLAEDDDLKAFDLRAATKKDLKKNPLWKGKTPGKLDDVNNLAVSDNKVYLAADDGFGCLDLVSGQPLWAHKIDERGMPGYIIGSPAGTRAIGTLYQWGNPAFVRMVVIDTSTGLEIARYPQERTDKGKPTFASVDRNHRVRWLDEDRVLIESDDEDVAYSLTGSGLERVWSRAKPRPPVYPEDLELAAELKKKQRKIAIAMAIGGLVLAVGAGEVGSKIAQDILLVGGSVAIVAGLALLADSARTPEAIASGLPQNYGKRALDRYQARQRLIDPFVRVDIVQTGDGKGHAIQRVDLRTGELLDEMRLPSQGRIEADVAFSLVYQRPSEKRTSLRAHAVAGFSSQTLADFAVLTTGG